VSLEIGWMDNKKEQYYYTTKLDQEAVAG